jgi:hypothetical protein
MAVTHSGGFSCHFDLDGSAEALTLERIRHDISPNFLRWTHSSTSRRKKNATEQSTRGEGVNQSSEPGPDLTMVTAKVLARVSVPPASFFAGLRRMDFAPPPLLRINGAEASGRGESRDER